MKKKIGLVMTGGGARAAYQVGVIRALYEILKTKDHLVDVISGNSAGAINSTYLAANSQDWDGATQHLVDLWTKLKPQNIFDLRKRTISDLGLKWISGTVFGGLTTKGNHVNHLLDTTPLKELLRNEINFSQIGENLKKENLQGISLSATNYHSGSSVIFYQAQDHILDWKRSDRFSLRTNLNLDHLMASAAIPFFFPPIKIQNCYFGDGCIRQMTPLSPAIHLGAEKILAIGVRYSQDSHSVQERTFSHLPAPSLGEIAGTLLNALFLDSLDADVERLRRINSLIDQGAKSQFKSIPTFLIRPSRDLGEMSSDITKELPGILRYLLKGIGVTKEEGLDLLSYLAFDPSYTKPLVELGYEDAFRVKEQILDFFNDA